MSFFSVRPSSPRPPSPTGEQLPLGTEAHPKPETTQVTPPAPGTSPAPVTEHHHSEQAQSSSPALSPAVLTNLVEPIAGEGLPGGVPAHLAGLMQPEGEAPGARQGNNLPRFRAALSQVPALGGSPFLNHEDRVRAEAALQANNAAVPNPAHDPQRSDLELVAQVAQHNGPGAVPLGTLGARVLANQTFLAGMDALPVPPAHTPAAAVRTHLFRRAEELAGLDGGTVRSFSDLGHALAAAPANAMQGNGEAPALFDLGQAPLLQALGDLAIHYFVSPDPSAAPGAELKNVTAMEVDETPTNAMQAVSGVRPRRPPPTAEELETVRRVTAFRDAMVGSGGSGAHIDPETRSFFCRTLRLGGQHENVGRVSNLALLAEVMRRPGAANSFVDFEGPRFSNILPGSGPPAVFESFRQPDENTFPGRLWTRIVGELEHPGGQFNRRELAPLRTMGDIARAINEVRGLRYEDPHMRMQNSRSADSAERAFIALYMYYFVSTEVGEAAETSGPTLYLSEPPNGRFARHWMQVPTLTVSARASAGPALSQQTKEAMPAFREVAERMILGRQVAGNEVPDLLGPHPGRVADLSTVVAAVAGNLVPAIMQGLAPLVAGGEQMSSLSLIRHIEGLIDRGAITQAHPLWPQIEGAFQQLGAALRDVVTTFENVLAGDAQVAAVLRAILSPPQNNETALLGRLAIAALNYYGVDPAQNPQLSAQANGLVQAGQVRIREIGSTAARGDPRLLAIMDTFPESAHFLAAAQRSLARQAPNSQINQLVQEAASFSELAAIYRESLAPGNADGAGEQTARNALLFEIGSAVVDFYDKGTIGSR